jgi:hypothetical protein
MMPRLHLAYSVDNDYSVLTLTIILGLVFILFLIPSITYFLKIENIFTRIFERIAGEGAWNFALLGCFVSCSIFCLTAWFAIPTFIQVRELYNNKQFTIVEGRVKDYSPMPYQGHAHEYFTVKGVAFSFSDYDGTYGGYHNAASHGGIIRPNLYVRIGYYHSGITNIIFKLETE